MKYILILTFLLSPIILFGEVLPSMTDAINEAKSKKKHILLSFDVKYFFKNLTKTQKTLLQDYITVAVDEESFRQKKFDKTNKIRYTTVKAEIKRNEKIRKDIEKLDRRNRQILEELNIDSEGIFLVHYKTLNFIRLTNAILDEDNLYSARNLLEQKVSGKFVRPKDSFVKGWYADFEKACDVASQEDKPVLLLLSPLLSANTQQKLLSIVGDKALCVSVFYSKTIDNSFSLYNSKFKEKEEELLNKYYPDWQEKGIYSKIILINPAKKMEMTSECNWKLLPDIIDNLKNGIIEYYYMEFSIYGSNWEKIKEKALLANKKIVVLGEDCLKNIKHKSGFYINTKDYILFSNVDDAKYEGKEKLSELDVFITAADSYKNVCIYDPSIDKYKIVPIDTLYVEVPSGNLLNAKKQTQQINSKSR